MAAYALLCYAMWVDVRVREIPDWVSLGLLALAILNGAAVHWISLVFGALIYLLLFFLWSLGVIGGGDVKLIAVTSLFFMPYEQLIFLLNIGLAGGVLAMLYLFGRNRLPIISKRTTKNRVLRVEAWRIRRGMSLPYAVAIAIGFIMTTLRGEW
ncbi:A24 family peptidase [Acetobacter fabarum]|uniref:A24 family peptidase n=1 Tax=Acetobacter fabarum TaxID=483199 RepID=UPI0039E879D7